MMKILLLLVALVLACAVQVRADKSETLALTQRIARVMMRRSCAHLLSSSACCVCVSFAVLVAGSNTYWNYRHQADVCHAYHLLRRFGIPEANILTFIFDDIALDPMNPFPGRMFNKPTNNMTRGVDVYAGCGGSLDANVYRGADVIPDVFTAAITGNVSGVPAGKSLLTSTAEDDVFIFFTDHGQREEDEAALALGCSSC
jgi:legumain